MLNILRNKYTGIKIAEIIVDHVPYENQYHTFPEDLRPIRERGDMVKVWNSIERSLKEMFPAKKLQGAVLPPINWTKYLKNAIPALFILAFLFWWLLRTPDTEPQEVINITPDNAPVVEFSSDKSLCVAPCTIVFTNASEKSDTFHWDFGDDNISKEENPSHTYENAGTFRVTLTSSGKGQSKENTRDISITSKTSELKQVHPDDGSAFNAINHFIQFSWSDEPGAVFYTVEIDSYSNSSGQWNS